MSFLGKVTWIAFLVWLVIGLVIYFAYARHRSVLNQTPEEAAPVAAS
jgi:APA family basic amino acid/polyamine antiporter